MLYFVHISLCINFVVEFKTKIQITQWKNPIFPAITLPFQIALYVVPSVSTTENLFVAILNYIFLNHTVTSSLSGLLTYCSLWFSIIVGFSLTLELPRDQLWQKLYFLMQFKKVNICLYPMVCLCNICNDLFSWVFMDFGSTR